MIVVADTTPLIVLSKIREIELLPALFGEVFIPVAVRAELVAGDRYQLGYELGTHPPAWLIEKSPAALQAIAEIDRGELAAISLAIELNAEFLLIDDMLGRAAALKRQLRIIGTIGILELAAARRLVNLADAFARLKSTDFWVPHKLLDERLKFFLATQGGSP